MNDAPTMMMRLATVIVLVAISFAIVAVNYTLSRIADQSSAEQVRMTQ